MAWRSAGISAFPLVYRRKRPMVKWSQYRDRLPTQGELARFFAKTDTNLAIVCGGEFGLVVLDFDLANGYNDFLKTIPRGIAKILENTHHVKTPRGLHVYLKCKNIKSFKDKERSIDIKSDGGYVVAPFSVHPTGETYEDVGEFNVNKILSVPESVIYGMFPEADRDISVDWTSFPKYKTNNNSIFPSPNADIEDIKSRISILRIAMDYTPMFPERRDKRFWKGKCPVPQHHDTDPSFWVDTETGLCGCFGNCPLNEKSTDAIGLYALINGITYKEAIQELSDR